MMIIVSNYLFLSLGRSITTSYPAVTSTTTTAAADDKMTDTDDTNWNAKRSSSRGRALVRMFEPVMGTNWVPTPEYLASSKLVAPHELLLVSDLRPLLLLMDIGSCASAEKHTRVQCVTVSMGDVVIENLPRIGDMLELRASPVSVGQTSLEIAVLVVAHGNATTTDSNSNHDHDHDDEENEDHPAQTRRVCEAFFTYVTTRGPNGEKRYSPKLEEPSLLSSSSQEDDDDDFLNTNNDINTNNSIIPASHQKRLKWERTIAYFRKELIRSEKQFAKVMSQHCTEVFSSSLVQGRGRGQVQHTNINRGVPKDIFEMSEVVLPSHQNHMKHLFGGVVMGWMCKSVIAGCVKACRLPANKFLIRAIHRVDFPTGASVSDHVFFRPRITAIFEDGRSAEFEVKVGKRCITNHDATNARHGGYDETVMNVGHFYVSGSSSYLTEYEDKSFINSSSNNVSKEEKLPTNIAPFAKLLRTRAQFYSDDSIHNKRERAMAKQRRKSLLARRHLFSGLGEPINWDTTLKVQAPLLTILSLLYLCDTYEDSSAGDNLEEDSDGDEDNIYGCASGNAHTGSPWKVIDLQASRDQTGEWRKSDTDTYILRGKTVISREKRNDASSNDSSFLEAVVNVLRHHRPRWDPTCKVVNILEKDHLEEKDDKGIEWDIVEYVMKAKEAESKFCLLRAAAYMDNEGGSICNNKTERKSAVLASRSVIHEKSDKTVMNNRVLPSGWVLKVIENDNNDGKYKDHELIHITFVMEHDFHRLRNSAFKGNLNVKDEHIAAFLGRHMCQWLRNLSSFDYTIR